MLSLLVQLAALVVVLIGWGFWVWFATGRRSLTYRAWGIWCLLCGAAAHALILQQLWYLGLPISRTAWLSGLVALSGVCGWFKMRSALFARGNKSAIVQLLAIAVVGLVVCALHGWSLFARGAEHYFGRGEYDQFNYVVTAQYIADYSGTTSFDTVTESPALMKGREASKERITQSVLHAELAILSGVDAQQSYGVVTLLFLLLFGLALLGYFIAVGASPAMAAAAAILISSLPDVTNVHLNGFLSQTSSFWTFVAIPGVLLRGHSTWRHAVIAGAFVGFLIGSYTELAPLGWATAMLAAALVTPPPQLVRQLGIITLISLLLNCGYLPDAGMFFFSQLSHAQGPNWLATWTPNSGTWKGFGRNFSGEFSGLVPATVGVCTAFLMIGALWSLPRPLKKRVTILVIIPSCAMVGLLMLPSFPAYAFGKLMMSIAPLYLLVILCAALRSGRLTSIFLLAAAVVGLFAVREAIRSQQELVQGTTKTAEVDLASVSQLRELLKDHAPTFYISAEYPLGAAWLTYYLRSEKIYLAFQEVSDRSFPSEWHSFRQLPVGIENLYWVDPTTVRQLRQYDPYPTITITGGDRETHGKASVWRFQTELSIRIHFAGALPGRLRWFCCEAVAGAGAPVAIEVMTDDGNGMVTSGHMSAVPANMQAETYTIRLRNKERGAAVVSIFGLEPVRRSLMAPYRFDPVQLAKAK